MKALRNLFDKMRPSFEDGGKLHMFKSVFDGFETFMFVSPTASTQGTHIHDCMDSKRLMTFVIIALMPAMLFGMYNVGYQHYHLTGVEATFVETFLYGFGAVLPKILVSYIVGLGIEFAVAQWKNEEIQEGFLVSGMIIPMIIPVTTPLWMLAIATAFAVIFAKEVFGGTGYNIFNVALVTRAFLFFSYPQAMTGDNVWVSNTLFGTTDGILAATPLSATPGNTIADMGYTFNDMLFGFIAGSIGETSVIAIAIGAVILVCTGVASWKTMLSVFVGGAVAAVVYDNVCPAVDPENIKETARFYTAHIGTLEHLVMGGFAFGAVFMATDPVTSARTETGKWIYGFLIGVIAISVRVIGGYPEGMMLAILAMNMFAPLIDYFVVDSNIKKRKNRSK
ncbi:MAG: NADH:ubiquinone reductase (Na(+)-transporting) subunit B [Paludibacteraceae bacterium]|nr:NADH:ubiquinone reductase (Na(+)-transporting) subunit B [Paludibacteraceae bacterium]